MNRMQRPVFTAMIAASSLCAQSPTMTHPHFGTYAAGSPEVTAPATLQTSDIVSRDQGSATITTRVSAAQLGFPAGLPLSQIEISAMCLGNDVFAPWGPDTAPPSPLTVRHTEVQFSVSSGSTLQFMPPAGSPTPVAPCSGSPISSQIFAVQLTSNGSSVAYTSPVPVLCGSGSTASGNSTSIGSMCWDPGTGHEFPVFFTITLATAAMLRGQTNFPQYANADSRNIYCALPGAEPSVCFNGAGFLTNGTALDAIGMGPFGNVVFSIAPGSTQIGVPMATSGGAAVVTPNENTLIGYVPPTAPLWGYIPPAPSGKAIGAPFIWCPSWYLGLGDQNGGNPSANGINDNLNGLQFGDPSGLDGYSGNLPLRGSLGDAARDRLHLTVGNAGGNGGGIFHVRSAPWTPMTIELLLSNVTMDVGTGGPEMLSQPAAGGIFEWALMVNVGSLAEPDCQVFTGAPFAPTTVFMFDPSAVNFGTSLFVAAGTINGLPYLWTPGSLPLPPLTADWAQTIAGGLPEGIFTLQAIVGYRRSSSTALTYYATNCVQIDVNDKHVPFEAP